MSTASRVLEDVTDAADVEQLEPEIAEAMPESAHTRAQGGAVGGALGPTGGNEVVV